MQKDKEKYSTKQEKMLYEALCNRGVGATLKYYDKHKTVDIAILGSKIYIEVDGLQHFTKPKQIISDFQRHHYSDDDHVDTFYVTNQIIDKYLDKVVDALVKVIEIKSKK